jgi:NADH:ubiquinone oxidoreductase subunit C
MFKFINGFVWKKKKIYIFLDFFFFHSIFFFFKFNNIVQLNSLIDIVAIDFPFKIKNRFDVTYSFLNYFFNFRFFFKTFISYVGAIPSSTFFFLSGFWLEREVWDLFGIKFFLHFDLRRILTDYGFFGHPLRKDFPLIGYLEIRYDDLYQSILIDPVEITQKFRFFKFENP